MGETDEVEECWAKAEEGTGVSYLEQDVKESRNGVSGKSGAAGGEGVLSLKPSAQAPHARTHTDRPANASTSKSGRPQRPTRVPPPTPHCLHRLHPRPRRLHAKRDVLLSHAAAAPSSPPHIASHSRQPAVWA
jgi:hypothetical protein